MERVDWETIEIETIIKFLNDNPSATRNFDKLTEIVQARNVVDENKRKVAKAINGYSVEYNVEVLSAYADV